MPNQFKDAGLELLAMADVGTDESHPYHIIVHEDERFWKRAIVGGQMAVLEAYVEGWWDSNNLAEVMTRVYYANPTFKTGIGTLFIALQDMFWNRQTKEASRKVGKEHYDFPIEIYRPILGERLIYSCAYFEHTDDLDQAQLDKTLLIGKPGKADIRPGMDVLDIGCGWGEMAKIYGEMGVNYTGLSISENQIAHAREICAHLPNVKFILGDYRDHEGQYDRIVSVGMFEHVGRHNHREYFEKVHSLLKPDGRVLCHSIFNSIPRPNTVFLEKYIFPGGDLPAMSQVEKAIDGLFTVWDDHEFGRYYARTLHIWLERFDAFVQSLLPEDVVRIFGSMFPHYWGDISAEERARRTIRVLRMYFSLCEVSFMTRMCQLRQLTMTKSNHRLLDYAPSR